MAAAGFISLPLGQMPNTQANFGDDMLQSPKSPTGEGYRNRLRTDSIIGMPSPANFPPYPAPWVQDVFNHGMYGHGMPMAAMSPPWGVPDGVLPPFYGHLPGELRVPQDALHGYAFGDIPMPGMPMPGAQHHAPPGHFSTGKSRGGAAKERGAAVAAEKAAAIAAAAAADARTDVASMDESSRTTVMLRNLPRSFGRDGLLQLLNANGFEGRYDFVYMPFDFDTYKNLSHAFVNMATPADAQDIWSKLDGLEDWPVPHDSPCKLAWNDKQQGQTSLIARYRDSPVMHKTVPDECKPILFHKGSPVEFPAPTQAIKAPKIRKKNDDPKIKN